MKVALADGSRPCALCGQAAHVTALDGRQLCADCAPRARRDEFASLRQRADWFRAQKAVYPALPWWFLGWRFAQVEARILRQRLTR